MKKILYIGNKLEKHGASPTSIDTLPRLLQKEGFSFNTVSSLRNKPLRLLHMLSAIFLKWRRTKLVLIDTYSTTNFWYARLSGALCRFLKIPYIFLLHGGGLRSRFENASEKTLELFRNAKANIVPSRFLSDQLQKFEFGNIIIIPNSIDISKYAFKKREILEPKILWLRAFDEVYNPQMALETLEILIAKHPEAELCMIGPDKDGSLIESKLSAKEKDLPVKFMGKMSKNEWIELSGNYDVFLNTTSIDNTPVSVLEAMALGIPVVSTNVGGIPYLIKHEENGLLVPAKQPAEMAKAVSRLLTDVSLATKLSLKGRESVENYDWKKVKHFWLELLT